MAAFAIAGCAADKVRGNSTADNNEQAAETTPAATQQQQNAEGMAPDFTLNDINGKPLALSSLRGKYVVIDFWGSWCGWCIKGIPKMKEYYAKY